MDPLPIYEQLKYRVNTYISVVQEQLQVDSETKLSSTLLRKK